MTWDGIERDDPMKVRREGQRIGEFLVLEDSGIRTVKGEILWLARNEDTGKIVFKKSSYLSKKARLLGVPKP